MEGHFWVAVIVGLILAIFVVMGLSRFSRREKRLRDARFRRWWSDPHRDQFNHLVNTDPYERQRAEWNRMRGGK